MFNVVSPLDITNYANRKKAPYLVILVQTVILTDNFHA